MLVLCSPMYSLCPPDKARDALTGHAFGGVEEGDAPEVSVGAQKRGIGAPYALPELKAREALSPARDRARAALFHHCTQINAY